MLHQIWFPVTLFHSLSYSLFISYSPSYFFSLFPIAFFLSNTFLINFFAISILMFLSIFTFFIPPPSLSIYLQSSYLYLYFSSQFVNFCFTHSFAPYLSTLPFFPSLLSSRQNRQISFYHILSFLSHLILSYFLLALLTIKQKNWKYVLVSDFTAFYFFQMTLKYYIYSKRNGLSSPWLGLFCKWKCNFFL